MSETKVSIRGFYKEHKDAIKIGAAAVLGIGAAVAFRKYTRPTMDDVDLPFTELGNGLAAITDDRGAHICGITTLGDLGQHGELILNALASEDNTVTKDTIVYVDTLRIAK